ncbi:Monocarboxylate transporter 12, partial [Stegodyphus mimosarum]
MMIAKYFNRRRGLANGLTMSGNALGGIVMPLVAHKLISEYALRGCFLIMGSLLLNSCVGIMLWQPVEWHQKKSPIEAIPILDENPQEALSQSDSPEADTSVEEELTVTNKESLLNEPLPFESGLDLSLDISVAVKICTPEIFISKRDIDMYASGPNLYSNGNCIAVHNKRIPRGGSSPHLADMSKSNDKMYGSSGSTESLPNMFKLSPRLMKHGSRASSFMYLSSYSFGPTASAILTKEHFTGLDFGDSKDMSDDSQELEKHKKWTLFPCLRKLALDLSIFEKSRFYIMTVSLFFHVLGYPGTQLFL